MNRDFVQSVRAVIPSRMFNMLARNRAFLRVMADFNGKYKRECPICRYSGYFTAYGSPLRFDASCPKCRSLERHRQHFLLVQRNPQWIDGARVLHFAPERCFVDDYTKRASRYVRADYFAGPGETKVDIQNMQFDDNSFDVIICHQIMEHVPDDARAVAELYRTVRSGGVVLISTPIVFTWEKTYTNPSITTEADRDLHFGQGDHVRWYGRDFRDLVESAGFVLTEDIAAEPEVSRFSLLRGDMMYIAQKPM